MKFCVNCEMMYYVSIDQDNEDKLIYYCRNCGHKDTNVSNDAICVMNTNITKGKQQFHHIVNAYTKMDPTLPRLYNVPCANINCSTNNDQPDKREVIYMRYDDENLKYIYICNHCDFQWT
jgi:DNA-directed RNA polymerase subunit M/transcription elongation factor TFIIS